MDIREALEKRHAREFDDIDLMRVLVSHQSWHVPSEEVDGQMRLLMAQADGKAWLNIFTDEDALKEHLRLAGHQQEQGWVATTGEWLFNSVHDEMAGLAINPGLEHGLHFQSQHFDMLRSWAQVLRVERALENVDDDQATLMLLGTSDFWIGLVATDDKGNAQLALAPDQQGRPLAAVFTAPDAARIFTRAASEGLGKTVTVRPLKGQEMFTELSQMPLVGLVVNCMGPTDPVALSIDFAQGFVPQRMKPQGQA